MELEGFASSTFAHGGEARTVYRRGAGPAVVVMHEMPGITPEAATFARRVADAGFTVFMPSLFGTPGKAMTPGYSVSQIARGCVRREFEVLAAHRSSPITDWLRALARRAFDEIGGKGVGAIGMCFTGNFALAMAVDPILMAPVLSQPSLPFPLSKALRAGIATSPEDLAVVKRRAKDEGLRVLGLRFTGDRLCPTARFDTLRRELGGAFEAIEIDSSAGNSAMISRTAHSVVTLDLVDREGHPTRAALDRVLAFFSERLR